MGGVIYPVAIKYDPKFGDAFWNSSEVNMRIVKKYRYENLTIKKKLTYTHIPYFQLNTSLAYSRGGGGVSPRGLYFTYNKLYPPPPLFGSYIFPSSEINLTVQEFCIYYKSVYIINNTFMNDMTIFGAHLFI